MVSKKLFYDYQIDAIKKLKSGSILVGGVGSGKSRTAIGYFLVRECDPIFNKKGEVTKLKSPKDLYIITTARKRDTLDWEKECAPFGLTRDPEYSYAHIKVTIDSWNSIHKYTQIKDAFFIFDEQRAIGSGEWAKSFIKISKSNRWILLSATPGDNWMDYIPVFVANKFYKHRSEFIKEHVVFSRYTKFPKVEKFLNTSKLERLRASLIVPMNFERKTIRHQIDVPVSFKKATYLQVLKARRDPFDKNKPIQNISGLCFCLRKLVNSDQSRLDAIEQIASRHKKLVIFYNFNYELEMLRSLKYDLKDYTLAEWNGTNHEPIPATDKWLYLVQYTAGAEGWNCTETDAMIFFSLNYSYKIMEQAAGRIDRLNTKYHDLYYYYLMSNSSIDKGIRRALDNKEDFNDRMFKHATNTRTKNTD